MGFVVPCVLLPIKRIFLFHYYAFIISLILLRFCFFLHTVDNKKKFVLGTISSQNCLKQYYYHTQEINLSNACSQ